MGAVERLRELGAGREILGEPAPRERDGLLVSPRNADLAPEERAAAPAVFRALLAGQLLYGLGERKSAKILKAVRLALEMEPGLTVEAARRRGRFDAPDCGKNQRAGGLDRGRLGGQDPRRGQRPARVSALIPIRNSFFT